MKHHLIVSLLASAAVALSATAGVKDDFKADIKASANNYWAYPDQQLPALTPAPQGYTPFFMNHYGRHGSRWLIGKWAYEYPVQELEKGERNGKLTKRGKEVLAILKQVRDDAQGRDGELSDVGHEQHQRIAARMYKNFPEIFAGDAPVRARSTIVIRCILSMQNEVDVLKSLNPQLRITTDASEAEMYYMNYDDPAVKPLRQSAYKYFDEFRDKHVKVDGTLKRLFTDKKFMRDSIDGFKFANALFDIVGNMQSHHAYDNINLYDLFTLDEAYNMWSYNNMRWYIYSGETPLTQCRVDFMEANLVRSFIEDADHAINMGGNSASLRFGHESVVLPLVCLMGINGMDYQTTDLDNLAEHWQSYKVFPMACNVQMVYYRNAQDDVLVKVLLNEREATLPVHTDMAPYYRWSDVRDYLLDKLSRQPYIPTVIQ
ncbi:MAG: histidine phosphatase family protein [Muribaculaceae bacterium]|nr:histidine phosphatase family protein [Muribaculaceae bacterium]